MKNLVLYFTLTIFYAGTLAAQPSTITYQGKLSDNLGNALNLTGVQMTFAIYDNQAGGTLLWPDAGTVGKTVNVVQGLYTVQLGTGTGDDDAFTAAMFDGKTPWMEVKVGTETLPRTPVTNVPFALISGALSSAGWASPGSIGSSTPGSGAFTSLNVSGNATIGGSVLMNPVPDNTSASGLSSSVTIDENTLGFGAALFLASDGNYEMARATDTNHMPCVALAIETGTGLKKIIHEGYVRNDSWNWNVGKTIYVSRTSGQLTQSYPTDSGSQVQIVGYATHANRIYFSPNLMLIELK